ncbi:MAG: hypothetical protein QXP38_00155 [Nitrososphaerota archaeon]
MKYKCKVCGYVLGDKYSYGEALAHILSHHANLVEAFVDHFFIEAFIEAQE